MENAILKRDIENFCKALDMEYQVDFVKRYSEIGDSKLYGGKHCGSDAEHEGARFIAERLKEIGIRNVELIPCQTSRYQFHGATLKVKDKEIKPYGYVSPGTDGKTRKLELIDINKATKTDCGNADIEGKAVLFSAMGTVEGGNLAGQMEEAVNSGAKAILIYAVEDVLNEETIRVQPPNIVSPVPIVGICRKDANLLKAEIGKGKCVIELSVDAEYVPDGGITYNVVGQIPGAISEEVIVYTAHLDHYFRCLQDNMSSCSTLLGIAKAIIDAGIKPNRTIAFAFHGSHETGGKDTRYPYIYGSYKLTHEGKKEWTGKAVMNINFEYSALAQKRFQMLGYLGSNRVVQEYFPYSPELVGGFNEKVKDAPQEGYYMFSWGDSISYLSAGIPTITNDPVSEQFFEGSGPYVGRDHSNHDNWEIFSEQALEDNGRLYGALGLFVDSMPYMIMDYTEQVHRIRSEINVDLLESLKMPVKEYMSCVDHLETAAKKLNAYLLSKNNAYIEALKEGLADSEKAKWFADGRNINEKILESYKVITDNLDKINQFDFLCLATVKYSQNIELMQGAAEYIQAGEVEKAITECLASVDLCLPSYYFSEEVTEHMRKQICAPEFIDRRTWAAGRELNVATHYDLITTFTEEMETQKSFDQTLENLKKAIFKETSYIPDAMAEEMKTLKAVTEILEELTNEQSI